MKQQIGDDHEQHKEDRQSKHQEAKPADAMGKGIGGALPGDPRGKVAELGRASGAGHQGCRGAADHRRSHEEEVRRSGRFLGGGGEIVRVLLHRIGLPGEQSLIDEAVARPEEPTIGRDDGARLQLHHIASHERIDGNLPDRSVAQHACFEPHGTAQRVDRILGAMLLHDVEHHTQGDDNDNNDEACDLAGPG
jgi:hypothetical protein